MKNKKTSIPLPTAVAINKGTNIFVVPPSFTLSFTNNISTVPDDTRRYIGRFPFGLRELAKCSELIFTDFGNPLFHRPGSLYLLRISYSSLQSLTIKLLLHLLYQLLEQVW